MKFTVLSLRAAERDVGAILKFIAARSKTGAEAWARAFDNALVQLEESADSFPIAPEDDFVEFEVREALFKTRRGLIYRILLTIRDNTAIILHVRGPGQDLVDSMEIRNPD